MDAQNTPEDETSSIEYSHLHPAKLKSRDTILGATHDIEASFTGRVDVISLHRFFIESALEVRNAVKLYEEGIFDAAFYAVRTAVELARVVTYFSGDEQPTQNEQYSIWKGGDNKFPFDSTIRQNLVKACRPYKEVYSALTDFFSQRQAILKRVNKYIHKQGYFTFYEQGFEFPDHKHQRLGAIEDLFQDFISGAVAEILLLRLSVDPFPLLLKDPSIKYKIHYESMTIPMSDRTISQILGPSTVNRYMDTEFYKSHASIFENNEPLTEATFTLLNYQVYSRENWDDIKNQLNLLGTDDVIAVRMFNLSDSIVSIRTQGDLKHYCCDSLSLQYFSFNGCDFMRNSNGVTESNRPYRGSFLTCISVNGDDYWLQHTSKLSEGILAKLRDVRP
jgi:hypothetical protein